MGEVQDVESARPEDERLHWKLVTLISTCCFVFMTCPSYLWQGNVFSQELLAIGTNLATKSDLFRFSVPVALGALLTALANWQPEH